MTPRTLFTALARAEVVTWTLLLLGMVLKHVTATTELGVTVFGPVHGVVFLAYVLGTVLVAVDQRWPWRAALLALAAGVPPFATVWVERRLAGAGRLGGAWRLAPGGSEPRGWGERVLARALARPLAAVVVGAVGVLATAAVLVAVGPPGQVAGGV